MTQTATLTATYAGAPVPDNPWWVRLEQIPVTNDVATVGDTANLLDALYQVDPCTEVETTDETEEELTTEDVAEAASKTLDLAACAIAPDGSCEVQIKVIRSHQTEPYRLHVAGGSVIETVVVEEEIIKNIAVSEATETELEYPVIAAFTASWMADVTTASGRRPTIQRNGNMLYWDGSASGTLRAAYLTVYDLVTIKVAGVDGELGEALIRVVFHAMAEELTPELPDPAEMDRSLCGGSANLIIPKDRVTCYKAITVEQLCSCSKDKVGSYTYEQVVDCPDWVTRCPGGAPDCMALLGSETINEYVECAGDNQVSGTGRVWNVSSADYYRKVCCDDPPKNLPQCYEKTTSYRGGKGIVHGPQFWRDLYGPLTQFRPVSPPGGICGKHITRQVVQSGSCCDGVPEMAWDWEESADLIAVNSHGEVRVTDTGKGLYMWTLEGTGWSFVNSRKTYSTGVPWVQVYAGDIACGTGKITCTDGCSTAHGAVRSPHGAFSDACGVFGLQELDYGSADGLFRRHVVVCGDKCSINTGDTNQWGYGTTRVYLAAVYRWRRDGSGWVSDPAACSITAQWCITAELEQVVDNLGWGTVLRATYPATFALPDGPPTGDLSLYSCSAGEPCAWECE